MSSANIPVRLSCPLGSRCEEVKDGAIHRCAWFTQMQGQHPSTGESVDEWGCAIAWMPVLSVEMSRTNRGQTAALESFRNEVVKGNNALAIAMASAPMLPPETKDEKLIGSH